MRLASNVKKTIVLAALLFCLIAMPALFIERVRVQLMSITFPLWKWMGTFQGSLKKDELSKSLEVENNLLREELTKCRMILGHVNVIPKALSARVIYRDPMSWASSFWIDVGEETPYEESKRVVFKNSPVLYGKAVVGAIDYVGKKQSRVRLITDSGLKISVRAARGRAQHASFVENMDLFQKLLKGEKDLPISSQERAFLLKKLDQLKTHYDKSRQTWYLAKGVIQGSGAPLWRKKTVLRGTGFNYDFADEEGPARDLNSGESLESTSSLPAMPLIEVNDLLVTTGMDGVFPAGLPVATVTKVYPLKEGAYTYSIEALPKVSHIDELRMVFIIPPLGFVNEQ